MTKARQTFDAWFDRMFNDPEDWFREDMRHAWDAALAAQADAPAIQPQRMPSQRMPSHTVTPFCAGTQNGVTQCALEQWEREWPDKPTGWEDSEARLRLQEIVAALTRPECGKETR